MQYSLDRENLPKEYKGKNILYDEYKLWDLIDSFKPHHDDFDEDEVMSESINSIEEAHAALM